jgi:hypothetical protein
MAFPCTRSGSHDPAYPLRPCALLVDRTLAREAAVRRGLPAREVLLHLNRLMDWAAFWARRGLTEADRQDAAEWEGRWRELQPHVIEAVERGDEHAVH